MPEDKAELLDHYRRLRQRLLAVIDGLSDEIMTEPTIDGWSVKDHLVHLSLWDDLRAQEVERISAGHDSVWRMTHDQDEAYNAMAYELRRSLTPDQAKWELTISRQRLVTALSSASPRAMNAALYGEAGLRSGHDAEHTLWIKRWRSEKGV